LARLINRNAREAALPIWKASEPYMHAVPCGSNGSHIVFVVPADTVLAGLSNSRRENGGGSGGGIGGGVCGGGGTRHIAAAAASIDTLAALFVPNSEVTSVALFDVTTLQWLKVSPAICL
jgi:hypothetical protein